MLPKANRLRHWRDFDAVYQHGRSRRTPHLTLRALPPPPAVARASPPLSPSAASPGTESRTKGGTQLVDWEPQPTRIAIVVGAKVSKKSTIRNRIKRRLRAGVRQLLPRLSPGWQLVVRARPAARECDYAQFLRELEQMLADVEVLNGH